MKILYKVPLIVAAFLCVYFLAILGLGLLYMQPSFRRLQMDSALRNLDRAMAAVDRERRHLAMMDRDWSQWDDAYAFATGGSTSFIEANIIPPESWTGTGADIMAAYAMDGSLLYQGGYDGETGTVGRVDLLPQRAPPGAPYHRVAGNTQDITGFIGSPRGVFIIASTPILRSDATGEVAGSFIMGRLVNGELSAEISEQISAPTRLSPWSGSLPSGAVEEASGRFLADAPQNRIIHGYAVFRDFWNNPVLLVETDTVTEISDWARGTMAISGAMLILLGACFFLLVYFLLLLLVVRPVTAIRSFVEQVEAREDGAMSPAVLNRRDELGSLARAFVHMSSSLRIRRRELRAANEELEERIAARTRDLRASNEKLHLMAKVVETTSESVVITDLQANILSVNRAFCETSGYSEPELLNRNPRILKSGRHDEVFYQLMWKKLLAEGSWSGEIWDRRKNGEIYPKWLSINMINDGAGRPMCYVGLSSDITHIKKAQERLHRLAYFDPLTSLPNRALFRDRLERTILRCQRYGRQAGLLFLDLDRFKYINDAMGHAVGDIILMEAARRITSRIRKSDTVCRLGGDEFTVILEQVRQRDDMGEIAQGIIEAFSRPVIANGREVFIGASIGIAVYPDDDQTAEGLTRMADAAMYHAKESGRNTFRYVSGKIDAASKARLAREAELRQALERNEFVLHYQPVVSVEDRRVVGAEALVRWRRRDFPQLSGPSEFLRIAEDTGLIVRLGAWIMREACRDAAGWRDKGFPIPVSVNVSSRQLHERGFTAGVREALQESGLPPRMLVMEITESTMMADLDVVDAVLAELKEIGVRIAIDDFGTGFSSLSHLGRFPVDRLKIDQSFVREISAESRMNPIVDAIISMAKSLGIGTVAEGVETGEQMRFLSERGCAEMQGFLFSKAVAPEELLSYSMSAAAPGS